MAADFSATVKAARAQLQVPDLPMDWIRNRSREAERRDRIRFLIACSAGGILTLVGAAAIGGKLYEGVRVWLSGGEAAVGVRSLVMVREPTAEDLRTIAVRATFPIIFPVGLPSGTRVAMVLYAPAERPNTVTVEYRNERAKFRAGFSLFDSAIVNANETTPSGGSPRPSFRAAYHWTVGRETVLVPKTSVSSSEANHVELAMTKVSPNGSLASTEPMLRKVILLGELSDVVDIAERCAPVNGSSVLLDERKVQEISRLVKERKPVLDTRTIYLDNIPSVRGEPDYSKATLHWPKVVAVPEKGVEAIDAVLHAPKVSPLCNCEVLFNQPNSSTYLVWTIPVSPSASATKFAVDANTLKVISDDGRCE